MQWPYIPRHCNSIHRFYSWVTKSPTTRQKKWALIRMVYSQPPEVSQLAAPSWDREFGQATIQRRSGPSLPCKRRQFSAAANAKVSTRVLCAYRNCDRTCAVIMRFNECHLGCGSGKTNPIKEEDGRRHYSKEMRVLPRTFQGSKSAALLPHPLQRVHSKSASERCRRAQMPSQQVCKKVHV